MLSKIKTILSSTWSKAGALMLSLVTSAQAASLPTVDAPTRGGGGILKTIQDHAYDVGIFIGLGVCTIGFIVVANSCIATYGEIQDGKKKWKDLAMSGAFGGLLLVLVIWFLTEAAGIL